MTVLEARSTKKYVRDDVLVEPDWLEQHLHDPSVRVIEVDVSPASYNAGHIPGAVLWNIYADFKDAEYRPVDKAAIERIFARSGITAGSTVVFYGYAPAMGLLADEALRPRRCAAAQLRPRRVAARGPGVVSGNRVARDDQLPGRRARPPHQGRHSDVQKAVGDPRAALLDVRTQLEFDGERFWPSGGLEEGGRAGHIPGAVRLPIDEIRDERGAFVSAAELRRLFAAVDLDGDGEVIAYCTVGGRACTAWFVLTYLLGCDRVRVYDGSWAEWGRTPGAAVAQKGALSTPSRTRSSR